MYIPHGLKETEQVRVDQRIILKPLRHDGTKKSGCVCKVSVIIVWLPRIRINHIRSYECESVINLIDSKYHQIKVEPTQPRSLSSFLQCNTVACVPPERLIQIEQQIQVKTSVASRQSIDSAAIQFVSIVEKWKQFRYIIRSTYYRT